jgi:hypothetical protein
MVCYSEQYSELFDRTRFTVEHMHDQQRMITFVALAQFVPLVLFPWSLTVSSAIFMVLLLALSAFLGWALMQRKAWGVKLTIFVQGLNVIVRIITFFANVYDASSGLDIALLLTYVVSVVFSVVLLSYIDKPEVRLLFGS